MGSKSKYGAVKDGYVWLPIRSIWSIGSDRTDKHAYVMRAGNFALATEKYRVL